MRGIGWQKLQDRGSASRFPAPPTRWEATVTIRFRDKSCFGTDLGLWPWLKTMFFFVTQVWWISQGRKSQKMWPGINHAPAFCFWSKWALHSRIDLFSARCTNAEEELAKHPQQSISMNYELVCLCKVQKKNKPSCLWAVKDSNLYHLIIYLFIYLCRQPKFEPATLKLFPNGS